MDVGSARVEITGDVSQFASDVRRNLNRILTGIRVDPVQVQSDFTRAEREARDAAGNIEGEFARGAEGSEAALEQVDEDFQEPEANAERVSDSIATDFEDAGSRAGRALSSSAKFMAGAILGITAAATAAAAAVAGISLVQGFRRLTDIENATSALRGLGHEAETIDQIMSDANAAIEGTIIGLPDAAQVAANAVAAGIEPGRDLEETLRAAADAATITGADLGEIGSIMNVVAAANRVTMGEINRLQDRGLPILQFLADQYGVTADEAREMVSRGEVDFENFRDAISENIGGAALEATDTTEGAFDNMLFTLARIGQGLLSGVFPQFKEVFNGITELLLPIEEVANDVGSAIGAAFDVLQEGGSVGDAFATFRENLNPELFQEATSTIRDLVTNGLQFLGDNAGDIVDILLELRSAVFDAAMNMFMGIVEALPEVIPQVVSGLVDMITSLVDTITEALPQVVAAAGFLITGLVDGLVDALPEVISGAVQIVTTLLTGIVDLIPIIIGAGLRLIEGLIEGILTALPQIQLAMIEIIPTLVTALATMTPDLLLLGVRILTNIVQGIGNSLPTLIDTFQNEVIPTLVRTFRDEGPAMIEAGGQALIQFMQGFLDSMDIITTVIANDVIPTITEVFQDNPQILQSGVQVISTLVQALMDNIEMISEFISETMIPMMTTIIEENLPVIIDAGIMLLEAVIMGLIEAQPEINEAIINQIIPAMFRAFLVAVPAMNRAAAQLIGALVSSLWSTWSSRSGRIFESIRTAILRFFVRAGSWLVNAGKDIVLGLIRGIRSGFDEVRNTLGDLTSMLPDWKGPADVDRRILRDSGRMVMEGFQQGIEDQRGSIERALRDITDSIEMGGIDSATTFQGRVSGGDGPSAGIRIDNLNITPMEGREFRMEDIERELERTGVR